MLIVKASTGGGHHRLGDAASSRDPCHDLTEVRAVGKKRRAIDNRTAGPVRTR